MKGKYHYEYAAYTDNLNWGRMHIGTFPSMGQARMAAEHANRGVYIIRRVRVENDPRFDGE